MKRMNMKRITLIRIVCCFSLMLFSAASAEELIHVLQKGETLYAISRKYNVPADAIMSWNRLSDPDKLKAGQKIRIPDVYTVQKGDTLYGIARKLDITVETLLSSNRLSRKDTLKVGDRLYIPTVKSVTSATNSVETTVRASDAVPVPASVTVSNSVPMKPFEDPRTFQTKKVDSSVIWPVQVKDISYLSGKVYGVSITSDKGEHVKAISSGTVLSTGPYRGFGQVVFLQSKTGYIYVYGGLDVITPGPGDSLAFGDEIGILGADSLSGQPRLYFMVYNKDIPIDPAKAPRGY